MAILSPSEVLADDLPQFVPWYGLELELRRKDDVSPVVEDRVVVSELEIINPDPLPFPLLSENLRRDQNFLDETPDDNEGAADGVGNAYSQFAPLGFNGAFWYGRVSYDF